VEPPGPVPLDYEPPLNIGSPACRGRSRRLRGAAEVALGALPPKLIAAARHDPNSRTSAGACHTGQVSGAATATAAAPEQV